MAKLLVIALAIGLFVRKRWAYPVALGLDGAGTLAMVALAVVAPGPAWQWLLVAGFSLSLVALTRTAREAYGRAAPAGALTSPRMSLPRWLLPAAAVAIVAMLGSVGTYLIVHRPNPAVTLMQTRLTAWQVERGNPDSTEGGPAARRLLEQARRWPDVAKSFETLDRVWPDEPPVRAAVQSVNQALTRAGLPYMVEMWPGPRDRPLVLSHHIIARVPWRIGERTVDVLRLRRVDTLTVDFAMAGVTDEGLPVVLLDRIEAFLARDVPAAYGASRTERAARSLNEFDRAALKHLRAFLDQRLGAEMAAVGAALVERDSLVEEMRARLHDGRLQFEDMPERFVLGDAWLDSLKPATKDSRGEGPVILEADLKEVVKADERLQTPDMARVLDTLIELDAQSVEAHEARHALDEVEPVGPPPPQLFEVMEDSSTWIIGAADRELRAFLGELHDGQMSVCATLARIMRCLYGRGAARTQHSFAVIALLEQLDPKSEVEPEEQLDALCRVPDAELRNRLERAWQILYAAPMPPAARSAQRTTRPGHPG